MWLDKLVMKCHSNTPNLILLCIEKLKESKLITNKQSLWVYAQAKSKNLCLDPLIRSSLTNKTSMYTFTEALEWGLTQKSRVRFPSTQKIEWCFGLIIKSYNQKKNP